jgi:MFS family permease
LLSVIYHGWWVVLASFVVAVYVAGTIFFGFTAFFEPMVREFGWSYTEISFVVALRGLEMGIFAPIAGFLVDRHGSRKLVLAGAVTVGLGMILLSRTTTLLTFYGAFLLVAFGAGGCTSVVLMSAVARWFKRSIGKAFGVMACGYGAGGLLVPLLVWAIDDLGWRCTLLGAGIGMWILGIPLAFVIRDPTKEDRRAAAVELSEGQGSTESAPLTTRASGFAASVRSRDFWALNIAEALRMMVLTSVSTHVMPYLSTVGMSRQSAGLIAAALPLASIPGRFAFGWLADVWDKRHVMMTTYGFMLAGMLAFTQIRLTWPVVPFLLFFSPGFGGSMILRGAMLREYFGAGSFGKLLGITMGMASAGGMIGPPLAGWVFDTWGSFLYTWFGFSGLLLVCILIIWKMKRAR